MIWVSCTFWGVLNGPYPQYGWDFPEEIPERPRKRSQSLSWNFSREYRWDAPNPIIHGIWGFQSVSRILSPPVRLGTPLFSELVPERASQSWSWNSQQYWGYFWLKAMWRCTQTLFFFRRGPCQDTFFRDFFRAKPLKNKGFVDTPLKKRFWPTNRAGEKRTSEPRPLGPLAVPLVDPLVGWGSLSPALCVALGF